jgi:AraC-like DNA-binding protein/mannose-6-phosphate isomerase-like protein (cupin superfamily)
MMDASGYPITILSAAWNERGPAYHVEPHYRSETQWYAVQYGRAQMIVEGKAYTLNAGESILIKPGLKRSPRNATSRKEAIGYFWVNFDNHRLKLETGRVFTTPTVLQQDMASLVDELQTPGTHDANDLILSLTIRLLIGLSRSESDQKSLPSTSLTDALQRARIDQLDAFMKSNLHRSLTREDFARVVSLSPAHLARLYKQSSGKTLVDRLTELRIERAKHQLVGSSLSMTQIALEIGFNSSSHFTRLFQRHVGVSPLTYRQAKGRVWVREVKKQG